MAKKKTDEISTGSIFELISSIDSTAEIIEKSAYSNITDYISTGNYVLNACITGSIFKGIPTGRVSTLAGPSQSGKSYLSVSICREAQRMGYTPIYMDSEGAIDKDFVKRLGVDSNNFIIKQVNTIAEVSTFVAKLCEKIEAMKESERPKILLILDSLGNLTSNKEREDIVSGNDKRDMTKQQNIKAMFRVNMTPIARLHIAWIVVNHIYQTMDFFSRQVQGGGQGILYNSSVTLFLSTAKLDDKESDKRAADAKSEVVKTGVVVTAKPDKSRFTIPQKVRFVIPYYKKPNPYVGLDQFLDWEHGGIMRGKLYDKKQYDKLKDGERSACIPFEFDGKTLYAFPKENSKMVICKHLGEEVPLSELFSDKVFTDEYLHYIDDNIIRPAFELPDSIKFDEDLSEITDFAEDLSSGSIENDNTDDGTDFRE